MSAFFNEISAQVSAFFSSNEKAKPSLWTIFPEGSPSSFGGPKFPAKKDVERLIAAGADINERNHFGSTPLWAVLVPPAHTEEKIQLQKELLELLIKKKADINAIDTGNVSALHVAARLERKDLVKLLLDKGANIYAKSDAGTTVLHEAAQSGYKDLVEFLLDKGLDIHAKDNNGTTVLHVAAECGQRKLVEFLLANEADIHAKDNNGTTVLHAAAKSGKIKLVAFLLDNGADINVKDAKGTTVLHAAAQSGNKDLVEFLLANGADINVKDNEGQMPLQKALLFLKDQYNEKQYKEMTDAQLGQHIEINMKIVRLLIEKSATFTLKDNEDQTLLQHVLTVLELVEIKAQEVSLELLNVCAAGSNGDYQKQKMQKSLTNLNEAREELLYLLKILIQKDANINSADHEGQTPLHKVLKFLNSEDLKREERRFGSLKSDLEKRIEDKYSLDVSHIQNSFADNESVALEIYTKERYEELCKDTLQRELNAYEEKKTALEELKFLMRERALELAFLYINSGADVTLPDSTGSTPMSYIESMKNSDDKKALTKAISESPFLNMWEMAGPDYTSFFQWLPRELAEDVMNMAIKEEINPTSSGPRKTR